jgi:hypothetical protein
MKKDISYVTNTSKVLSETLDGETIIIDLESGNYYSMNRAGSALWAMLESKQSYNKIFEHLTARAKGDLGEFRTSLENAVALLKKDGLIVEAELSEVPGDAVIAVNETFEPVALVRYDDMQEMLLADPIHDVDKTGWPGVKPELKK